MELRHLRYFVAVAEAGHLTGAARRLHVAQQSLSAQIRDLERELGVALFVRHARGVALTRAGTEFLAYAREALAANARAVAHARQVGRPEAALRVGLLDCGPGEALFRQATAAFRAAYPHVALTLAPTPVFEHAAGVADGRLDVGFAVGAAPDVRGVAAELLARDTYVGALLPAAHPLAAVSAPEPADLARLPFLSLRPPLLPGVYDEDVAWLQAAGWGGRLDVALDDVAKLFAMVAAGAGWARGTAWGASAAPAGVTFRPLAGGRGASFDTYILTRTGDHQPRVAAFLTCLRAVCAADAADVDVAELLRPAQHPTAHPVRARRLSREVA